MDKPEDEYTCSICKQTFKKGLTNNEAEEQLKNEFPDVDVADCDLVCEDCFNEHFG